MDNITEAIKSNLRISDKIDFNHNVKLYMSRDAFMQFVKELVEGGMSIDNCAEDIELTRRFNRVNLEKYGIVDFYHDKELKEKEFYLK